MKRQQGYLLLEILVTLAITAITLSALVRFQLDVHHGAALAAQRSDALNLAAMKMEDLRSRIHAGVNMPADGADHVAIHERQWTLSAAEADDRLVLIELVVDWQGTDQQAYSLRLSGLAESSAAQISSVIPASPL